MIKYRILEEQIDGTWTPFGVAYNRSGQTVLFVPAWRAHKKLARTLEDLGERDYPSRTFPYRWREIQTASEPVSHPIDLLQRAFHTDKLFLSAPTAKNPTVEQSDLCFILMPVGKPDSEECSHWPDIYERIIKPVVEGSEKGFRAIRWDEVDLTGNISANIVIPICKANVVIADVTGENPGVMYALGIAHCFAKRTLVICQKGTTFPPVLRGIRSIQYEAEKDGGGPSFKEEISNVLRSAESSLERLANPVQTPLPNQFRGGLQTIAKNFDKEAVEFLLSYRDRMFDL